MKRSLLVLLAVVVAAAAVFLPPREAQAEGAVICIVGVDSAGAHDTMEPFTDGGTNCNWGAGASVGMQCPDLVVCYDPAARERFEDGGRQTGGRAATTAGDLCVDFVSNPDPYVINLNSQERNISLIMSSNNDAGTVGVCKMANTMRKRP